jgi:shikimate dehydrogenase
MEKTDAKQFRFGLLGKNISYSFSRGYFTTKFSELELPNYSYENFDLQDISEFKEVLKNTANLIGLNVTIPYKEAIISYLTELEPSALEIGAVNTIKISPSGLKG